MEVCLYLYLYVYTYVNVSLIKIYMHICDYGKGRARSSAWRYVSICTYMYVCMFQCLYSKHARACLLRISVRLAVVYYALKCRYITAYITAYIMPQSVWISDHYILCLKVSVQSRREGTDYVLALFFFFTHYFFFSCQAVRLRSALLIILSWNLFIVLLTDWLIDWFF